MERSDSGIRQGRLLALVAVGGAAAGGAWAGGVRVLGGGASAAAAWGALFGTVVMVAGAKLSRGAASGPVAEAGRPRRVVRQLLPALAWAAGLLAVALEFHLRIGVTGLYKPLRLVVPHEVTALYAVALSLHALFILWSEAKARRDALRRGAAVALVIAGGAAWLVQDLLRCVGY